MPCCGRRPRWVLRPHPASVEGTRLPHAQPRTSRAERQQRGASDVLARLRLREGCVRACRVRSGLGLRPALASRPLTTHGPPHPLTRAATKRVAVLRPEAAMGLAPTPGIRGRHSAPACPASHKPSRAPTTNRLGCSRSALPAGGLRSCVPSEVGQGPPARLCFKAAHDARPVAPADTSGNEGKNSFRATAIRRVHTRCSTCPGRMPRS